MSPFRHVEPPSPVTTGLTPEAAHARHILDVAAHGPPSARSLVVGLMQSLVTEGYRTSVSWYLAPSPTDDLHEVIFSLRAGDETEDHRWHDRREIASLLTEARRRSQGGDAMELWSGNGHGLRRLVIANEPGRPLQFVPAEERYYAGEEFRTAAAVAAWRERPAPTAGVVVQAVDAPELGRRAFPTESSGSVVSTGPVSNVPAIHAPPPDPPLNAETLGAALREALSEVQVEVDLGSMEDVVAGALRSALVELSPAVSDPSPRLQPVRQELTTGEVPLVAASQDRMRPRPQSSALDMAQAAGLFPDARGGTEHSDGSTAELEHLVERCVTEAIRSSLADRLPELINQLGDAVAPLTEPRPERPSLTEIPSELENVLASLVSSSLDASLTRRIPELVERLALAAAPLSADFERPSTEPDPVDVARSMAASILSPAEIAETLVFRLRPLLDEHNARAMLRESTDADRDRLTIEHMRASLNQLAEKMDLRLKGLEAEIRRYEKGPSTPDLSGAAKPTPTSVENDPPVLPSALRVVQSDDGP